MNNRLLSIALAMGLYLNGSPVVWASDCTYTLDEGDVVLGFTAFKTSKKVPVKGTLDDVEIPEKSGKSIEELLHQLKFKVDSTDVSTGDMVRNGRLEKHFFKLLNKNGSIEGIISKVTLQKNQGQAEVSITMNGNQHSIPLQLNLNDEEITATGTIDMLKLSMNTAYESIHKACKDLHKGDDGISKTWTEVDLEIKAMITKDCK